MAFTPFTEQDFELNQGRMPKPMGSGIGLDKRAPCWRFASLLMSGSGVLVAFTALLLKRAQIGFARPSAAAEAGTAPIRQSRSAGRLRSLAIHDDIVVGCFES